MKNIVIFSSLLLPTSQTFIKALGEKLQRFVPYYVGTRFVQGLSLPTDRTFVINRGGMSGKIQEGIFKLSGYAPDYYRYVLQINPALIHAQFGLSGALALPLAETFKIPLLVHFRGADATLEGQHLRFSSLNHWVYFRRLTRLKNQAKLFITVSKFIKNKLIEQDFFPNKIIVHYQGVDIENFLADPSVPRTKVVLFVGRLTEKKGCEYLIQSIAAVQREIPDLKLVLIGDGPLRISLEQLASKFLKQFEFLGFQEQSVVKKWMNLSHILAVPSVTTAMGEAEGLPNVVMEALAMGLPVVGTKHAGIPEVITHGLSGFLVPERSIDELTHHLLLLLRDQDLWQKFSFLGRKLVETRFNRDKQTRILEGIYESVL